MVILVNRHKEGNKQTFGTCTILDGDQPLFVSMSLERGWVDNIQNISCIPTGEYRMEFEYSNKFGTKLWEIKDVPGRSECKFHSANYWKQLNGCIALGVQPSDINYDGYMDITNSKETMKRFNKVLKGQRNIKLIIRDDRY